MSADVPIPHRYAEPTNRLPYCAECFARFDDPSFTEHHAMPDEYGSAVFPAELSPAVFPDPDARDARLEVETPDDLPPGATIDDDPEAFAAELVDEYAAAVSRVKANPYALLTDDELAAMQSRAFMDAARSWQEARAGQGPGWGAALMDSARGAEAFWRTLRAETARRKDAAR